MTSTKTARRSLPLASGPVAAPLAPTTRAEMDARGWDAVDVVFVSGDAYVDHPSFAMAILHRVLEAAGFRVAMLCQPDWKTVEPWRQFGRPRLFFAVSAGNMDSLINHYTANKKVRNDDAYSPGGRIGLRPDRATLPYCHRAREAFPGVPVIAGGVEASLRRLAHYDYWSDTVRKSILLDAKADLVVHGMGEEIIVEIAKRLAAGQTLKQLRDLRGVAYVLGASEAPLLPSPPVLRGRGVGGEGAAPRRGSNPTSASDNITTLQTGQLLTPGPSPVRGEGSTECSPADRGDRAARHMPEGYVDLSHLSPEERKSLPERFCLLPSFEEVKADKSKFIDATRIIHINTNPFNAQTLVQYHDRQAVVVTPPSLPLPEAAMDRVYDLPYTRRPHPRYTEPIPAFEMIKDSVTIMRGCFGGCTFCSITAHQGRIIQSRSQDSILKEIRTMAADPEFKGVISDIGGPTANMYQMRCSRPDVEAKCKRLSCVHPTICKLLGTDHGPLRELMERARHEPGIRKVLVASGIRMDLAQRDAKYMADLATHHVGGHLKVAPEHTDPHVLELMKKPDNLDFDGFAKAFKKASAAAGKPKQYIVPYYIASHPGSDIHAMIDLAVFLKRNGYRPDQVQDFIPAPFDIATCMYYTGVDPFTKTEVFIARALRDRKMQRALLQYFKPENYFEVRQALIDAGRTDLIGGGCDALISAQPPKEALDARRHGAQIALKADHVHTVKKGYRPNRAMQQRQSKPGRGKRK